MFFAQIERLCRERGVKLTPLTKELGFSSGNVTSWKKGTAPNTEAVLKFADYFGVSTDYLLKGSDKIKREVVENDDFDYVNMPVFIERASAGNGVPLYEDSPYNMVKFRSADVPRRATHGVYISGDSMDPLIKDGELIWLELNAPVDNGDIGLFVYNGEGYCKKVKIDYENGNTYLVSVNIKYRPIKLYEDDSFKTVGRIII